MLKNRMRVNKKLMILGFRYQSFVLNVDNNFQLILISFVGNVEKKDIFEHLFVYTRISYLFN